jgi:hypothetical protein
MIRIKKYKIPIYGGKFSVGFYNKDSKQEVIDKYNFSELDYYDAVTFKRKDNTEFCILFDSDRITPGIIAHEAKHLLNYVFKYNGLELDLDNDEAECYFLAWIVNRIHEAVRKFKLEIK